MAEGSGEVRTLGPYSASRTASTCARAGRARGIHEAGAHSARPNQIAPNRHEPHVGPIREKLAAVLATAALQRAADLHAQYRSAGMNFAGILTVAAVIRSSPS